MAAMSGANKRNRAHISAIGRELRKEIWPIELKEHFFQNIEHVNFQSLWNFWTRANRKKDKKLAIEDPGLQVFKT